MTSLESLTPRNQRVKRDHLFIGYVCPLVKVGHQHPYGYGLDRQEAGTSFRPGEPAPINCLNAPIPLLGFVPLSACNFSGDIQVIDTVRPLPYFGVADIRLAAPLENTFSGAVSR